MKIASIVENFLRVVTFLGSSMRLDLPLRSFMVQFIK